MRIVLSGLGSIGRRHLANARVLLPNAEITVLRHADTGAACPEFADRVVYSLEEACAQRPDAALICGPTTTHAQTAVELAKAGAHLFIEKPIAASSADAQRILSAACNSVVFVAYNLRFLPSLQRLAHEVRAGSVGQVGFVRAEVGQYLPDWRPGVDYRTTNSARTRLGGGILLELSHELDYVSWIAGPFTAVSATLARTSELEIEGHDVAELALHTTTGAIASIHLDMTQRSVTRSCKVVGADGTLEWDAVAGTLRRYCPANGWELLLTDERERNDMYLAELEHFFACVAGNARPLIDGESGARVVALVEAAERSHEERRTVTL